MHAVIPSVLFVFRAVTMSYLCGIVILATVLKVIYAQPPANIPDVCQNMPRFNEAPDCCKMPQLFEEKDYVKCGFPEENSVRAKKRVTQKDCPKFKCIAKKYNLLRDGEMDPELIYTFLNNFANKNPAYKSAVASAKKTCIGRQLTGMESCPPEKIMVCFGTVIGIECPGLQTDPRCDNIKEFIKTCIPYIIKF